MQPRREMVRYGATVVLGLAVDLGVARAAVALGLPLEVAAMAGVGAGAAFNYVLLEFWAFAGPKGGRAAARPLRYLGALAVTMAVRAALVWALEASLPAQTPPLLILVAAAGASFTVNFLLSKNWVFARQAPFSKSRKTDRNA